MLRFETFESEFSNISGKLAIQDTRKQTHMINKEQCKTTDGGIRDMYVIYICWNVGQNARTVNLLDIKLGN